MGPKPLFVKFFFDLFAFCSVGSYLLRKRTQRVPMPKSGPNSRFFETTRGQIVALLRRGARTVEELAQSVGLTDTAVRAHLSTLEPDGIVEHEGVRRTEGPGKPATVYRIRADAEAQFSTAYVPVLTALLDELADQLPPDQRDRIMRASGRR